MNRNILITGTTASGKTHYAKDCAAKLTNSADFSSIPQNRLLFLHLHEGYSYDDIVTGIQVSVNNGKLQYNTVYKCFAELCQRAANDKSNNYAAIFDDIDRVNIVDVFGELLYAIENRNETVTLRTGQAISVPENVYIIAVLQQPDAKFKPDYAFFRRFDIVELLADRSVLKKQYEINAFDKFNGIIKNHINPEFADKINYYLLGHGLFISDSEDSLKLRIYHQIIPIIKKYAEDGILNISNPMMSSIEAAAKTGVQSLSLINIEKTVDGIIENISWAQKLQDMDFVNNVQPRGAYAMMIVHFFDLTWASGLLDTKTLMIDLYLNNAIVSISPLYTGLPNGNILIENSNVQNYKYPGGGKKAAGITNKTALFYTDAKGKPLYKDKSTGRQYRLLTGVRDLSGTNKPIQNPTAAVYAANLVYVLVENYYKIYLNRISQLPGTNALQTIVKDDLAWIQQGTPYLLLGNNSLYSEMKKNLVVLWNKEGSTITKTINGVQVSAVLKGTSTMQNKDYMSVMDIINIHQMILQGPPGTSKTHGVFEFIDNEIAKSNTLLNRTAKREDCHLTAADYTAAESGNAAAINSNMILWDSVQFHPSYGYEDFVRGIEVSTNNSQIAYNSVNKILGKICVLAREVAKSNVKVFLVIDEINRANVAAVFGELIYALEYRNESVSTPYSVKIANIVDNTLMIPDNLYIIGTMNTADKSIGNIDYAIRRRFLFFPCLPDRNVITEFLLNNPISNPANVPKSEELYDVVERLFEDYLNEEYNKDDIQVGHTYFLAKTDDEMKNKFIYQILPILREYVKDGILVKSSDAQPTPAEQMIADYIFGYGSANQPIDEDQLWDDIYKNI